MRPLLLLIGDVDDWTLPSECAEMIEAMRGRGADASIVLYRGAFHYFDVVGQKRTVLDDVENRNKPGGCCGATVGYDRRRGRGRAPARGGLLRLATWERASPPWTPRSTSSRSSCRPSSTSTRPCRASIPPPRILGDERMGSGVVVDGRASSSP